MQALIFLSDFRKYSLDSFFFFLSLGLGDCEIEEWRVILSHS